MLPFGNGERSAGGTATEVQCGAARVMPEEDAGARVTPEGNAGARVTPEGGAGRTGHAGGRCGA